MTGEGEGEEENCHMLITSLLNEGAVIKIAWTDIRGLIICLSGQSGYSLYLFKADYLSKITVLTHPFGAFPPYNGFQNSALIFF